MHLSGLSGCSTGRLKAPKDGLQRSYLDPKALLLRPCKICSGGKKTEGVCKRMDGYIPGPLHVWHNTRASATVQSEASLDKPTSKYEVKLPKA